jgi:phosphatidylglycerophosphate synthase
MSPIDAQPNGTKSQPNEDKTKSKESGLRNQEIEEATNRLFIHRISSALIPLFIKLRTTPNSVSCMGALSGLAAAWFYCDFANPLACVLGLLCMIGWHVFDGADGQLARQTGQTSPLGFVIDGVCDYATFIFVYVALALALSLEYGPGVWFIVVSAGACHAIQAAAFEMQREFYIRWTGDEEYAQCLERTDEPSASTTVNIIARSYSVLQEIFRPLPFELESRLKEASLTGERRIRAQKNYQSNFRSIVVKWSLLSANNRTIAIFVCCISGQPLAYFVFEIVILSLTMFGLLKMNKSAKNAFAAQLDL